MADVQVDEPLAPMFELHQRQAVVATIAVYESVVTEGKGILQLDSNGRVRTFEEKKQRGAGRALINSGVYVLEPALLESVAGGAESDFGDDVFPMALEEGLPIFGYRAAASVIDIGTPDGLALACASVREVV